MRGMFPEPPQSVTFAYDAPLDRVVLSAYGQAIAWVAADCYELWRAGAFNLDGLLCADQFAYTPPLAKLQAG